jgi:hypothetical protein
MLGEAPERASAARQHVDVTHSHLYLHNVPLPSILSSGVPHYLMTCDQDSQILNYSPSTAPTLSLIGRHLIFSVKTNGN